MSVSEFLQKRFLGASWSRISLLVVAVVLALGLSLWLGSFTSPSLPALAQSPSPSLQDLQQWRQTLDEYRSGVSQQRQQIQQLEGAARDRLGGLRRHVQATAAQIQANTTKLQQAQQGLQRLAAAFAAAEQAYREKQTVTVARLRFLQRRRHTQSWAALLHSQTLDEFLDRRYQLQLVYQADRQLLAALKTETDRLQAQKLDLEAQKNQIALLAQQLLNQKADYEAQEKEQAQLVSRLVSDRQALEAAEDQLTKDSQTLAIVIQQRTAKPRFNPGGRIAYGTGQMLLPTSGPITSNFGWRVHPILGTSRFHAGTDFGAPYGSPILAADSGTVLLADWYGGYGNAVIIDHGNGLTTLYGHASELYVQEGQVVQRGQAIAAVGSTGLSTGPHLHFEVRQQGEPVDPIAYLR